MTEAEQVAWEQVWDWRSYMTLPDAWEALGRSRKDRGSWSEVAKKLARLWVEMQTETFNKAA